jgi:hypothetical protein
METGLEEFISPTYTIEQSKTRPTDTKHNLVSHAAMTFSFARLLIHDADNLCVQC